MFPSVYLGMNLTLELLLYLKIERNKASVVYLGRQLHLNTDPGTLIQIRSLAFSAAALVFDFFDLIYELSWDSPCRAEKKSYKRQKLLVVVCPTSLSVGVLLLSKNCPEPLCSLVTEKKVVFSSLYLSRKMPLHDFCVYVFLVMKARDNNSVFNY